MPDEDKKKTLPAGEVVININDLKGIIAEATKDMALPQIDELKAQMQHVERKALFPDGEKEFAETCGKSVIDSRCFQKDFGTKQGFVGAQSGVDMANSFRAGAGPWLKLSPSMEKFANIIRCRGDLAEAERRFDFSIREYNTDVQKLNAEVLGEKAMTTTDAGALVPVEYLATVIEFATAQSQILPKLWRIPMGSLSLKIPKLVQSAGSYFGGLILYHPDEGGVKTETKPNFDTLTFTAKKLIGLIPLTDELIADSSINIINYITALTVRAFQYQTEQEVINGTGIANQMTGIIADPGINVVTRTTAGTLKYTDLVNLDSSLDENFNNLTYIGRRATINEMRNQVDTVGQPVYHDGFTTFLGASMAAQLMGYPAIKTRNCPAIGVKGDVILGDLGYYIWAVRSDMAIDQSKEYRFQYDETTLRFVMRQDGAPGVSVAFSILDRGWNSLE